MAEAIYLKKRSLYCLTRKSFLPPKPSLRGASFVLPLDEELAISLIVV